VGRRPIGTGPLSGDGGTAGSMAAPAWCRRLSGGRRRATGGSPMSRSIAGRLYEHDEFGPVHERLARLHDVMAGHVERWCGEWLPDGHLAWFVLDVVSELNLAGFYAGQVSKRREPLSTSTTRLPRHLGPVAKAPYTSRPPSRPSSPRSVIFPEPSSWQPPRSRTPGHSDAAPC
jgi:hypothetical protein